MTNVYPPQTRFVGVAPVYCSKCRERRSFEIFLDDPIALDGTARELSDRNAHGYCLFCNERRQDFRVVVAAAGIVERLRREKEKS